MTWQPESKTCSVYNNIVYTVTYASTGFTQKPQKYIVNVVKSTVKSLWTNNRQSAGAKQTYSLGVSFQFVELTPAEALTSGLLPATSTPLPADFWYGFHANLSAWLQAGATTLIMVGLLL